MREELAELCEDSWILQTAAVEYLKERRRLNLNRLGDWAQEQEESSDEGSKCNVMIHTFPFPSLYSLYYFTILAIFPIALAPFLSVLPLLAIVPAF